MLAKRTKIGKSKGVRIPKPVPRQGWPEAASALAAQDTPLLIDDIFEAEDIDSQIDTPLSDSADAPG